MQIKEKLDATDYDIVILGAGMAGLSLVYRAIKNNVWRDKKILIIEKELKIRNDKTFCFWSVKDNPHLKDFESLINYKWNQMQIFENSGEQIDLKIVAERSDYYYNLIHSLDFYETILGFLKTCNNVEIRYQIVKSLDSKIITTDDETQYLASEIFDTRNISIPTENQVQNKRYQYFLQHFKGVKLEIIDHDFNLDSINLMDFRTSQEFGTAFFYLLPFNKNEIFLEYTLFNKKLLQDSEYDRQIEIYLKEVLGLKIQDYTILETEFGVIPMTNYQFKRQNNGVFNLGTRGGDTRASTGYTFYNTQRTITEILARYSEDEENKINNQAKLFQEPVNNLNRYFDSIFLRVLNQGNYKGSDMFGDIFKHAPLDSVLAFLDGEANISETFQIINSVKKLPFIKAL